ncbi:probable polygalacturonase At3g15720 [Chenopodium quinoa]|uniref:probable polygalacturonase At3g15720 n=1 Tax=Chenopodium quinoa TaxID=63459 RepID=UPI000B7781BA|nr:probable polygalacturonase At3g15720 [Chenopodium quinoa]
MYSFVVEIHMQGNSLLIGVYVLLHVFVSQLALGIRMENGSPLASPSNNISVLDCGAVGDGLKDDSLAFSKAWEAVCAIIGETPTLTIPDGPFLLTPVSFQGPCNASSIHVQIQGKLVAPENPETWKNCTDNTWIRFSGIDNLILDGSGEINGKGANWWHSANLSFGDNNFDTNSTALQLLSCNGLQLKDLTHVDSPNGHISIVSCNNATISNLHIVAPENSPNTDGIDISSSTQVQISDSIIETGDDCIAIGSGTSQLNITGITCGPGHGISVGSLGRDGETAQVEQIHVRNCTFNGSTNGARIKTWQGGSGYARNITFEDIPLINVENPIIIDQYYCNPGQTCAAQKSAVAIEGITYKGFQGTSASAAAISLNCSSTVACTGITMESINITASNPSDKAFGICINAKGTEDLVVPRVPCFVV